MKNLDYLKEQLTKLKALLDDPHPGLASWVQAYAETMETIVAWWNDEDRVMEERQRCLGIAMAEFTYWKGTCDEDPGGYGIEGMGAAANIQAGIALATPAEEYRAKIEERDAVQPRKEL